MTWFGNYSGLADQCDEALCGVEPVAPLRAILPRVEDEYAVLCDMSRCLKQQALPHVLRQRWGVCHVEPELDRRRYLVHVLSARPGGVNEGVVQFLFVDTDIFGDAQH